MIFTLFKKEIVQFFGSLTAYLILAVFILLSALFLWFFDGNMNLLSGGYATLSPFFEMAPWLYLLIVPAITMRLFAEEKRSGTMELILTHPITTFQLIISKMLSALVILLLTIALTFGYFLTIYWLGSPVGSIDVGATTGSYIGLVMLGLIFISIGIFCSSLTENQIVALVFALLFSYFFYGGFELIAALPLPSFFTSLLISSSISTHYESVSRGVLDSRDLFYFLSVITLFFFLTALSLHFRRYSLRFFFQRFSGVIIMILLFGIFSSVKLFRIDFTKEKRYTLSNQILTLIDEINDPISAEIYLDGELQPGFRKLQKAIEEKLIDLRHFSKTPLIIQKIDPYKMFSSKERTAYFEQLMRLGVEPVDLRIKTDQGFTTKMIFPSVILRCAGKVTVLNLLKNDPSLPPEENLNRSVELLEYEFARAIQNLNNHKKEQIAFLTGQNELDEWSVLDITNSLKNNFIVRHISTNELLNGLEDSIKALIIAAPENLFKERDKYAIDHYLMKGGKIMWLIDPVRVSLDSLSEGMTTIALPGDLNLADQFFHYGFRINNDLIQDTECMQIKVNTAPPGDSPRYSMAPWYFSPLMRPADNHSIGRNVNPVASEFVSSIDTVGNGSPIQKKILLTTSLYSKKLETPLAVQLGMIDAAPDQRYFNQSRLITGLLLEGSFSSVFNNRLTDGLSLPNTTQTLSQSLPTKMIIFSDGSLIANRVKRGSKVPQITPLGFDRVSKITFGNKELMINSIQYLCDDFSLMDLRTNSIQLRMLDKMKISDYRAIIQWINILFPFLLLLSGALLFIRIRKRLATF